MANNRLPYFCINGKFNFMRTKSYIKARKTIVRSKFGFELIALFHVVYNRKVLAVNGPKHCPLLKYVV